MKKLVLMIGIIFSLLSYSNPNVNMGALIGGGRTGELVITVTGSIDFGNLKNYTGLPVGISENITIVDTSLKPGETSSVKIFLDESSEITNGTTTLTVIPEFVEKQEYKNKKTVVITGDTAGENKTTFPVYARITGTKDERTTGVYTGAFTIRAQYEN